LGGLASVDVLGIKNIFRFTFTYHAIGMLEALFPSDPSFGLPRSWMDYGFAEPGIAIQFMLFLGSVLILCSVQLFCRQDLTAKM